MRLSAWWAGVVAVALAGGAVGQKAPLPRSPGLPFAARNLPDRIVLTPGADPAHDMAVTFRTDAAQATADAQLAIAVDGPTLDDHARPLTGTTIRHAATSNGDSNYHSVRFTGLTPDTAYAYRVRGSAGWSEWFQFRTAASQSRPFRFLYLGDVQNGILQHASRNIREAFRSNGGISLVLHAGDLVAQRDDLDFDDEWGEWNAAGAYNYAITPQLPAAGNHEYVRALRPDGTESYALGEHWGWQFALPGNGVAPVQSSTYFIDYQGVRFVILDGTAALDLGALDAQTRWLEQALSSRARWKVVLMHQPVFTCARPLDTPKLREAWAPLFDRYRVDLVLQGHDHCYSRLTSGQGKAASDRARAAGKPQGPVYLVSVAGSKMYALNDRARTQPDKAAEVTQLFQIVDVDRNQLKFRTYTVTGRLYDGFDLRRRPDGRNRLIELGVPTVPMRSCASGAGPDGGKCIARPQS